MTGTFVSIALDNLSTITGGTNHAPFIPATDPLAGARSAAVAPLIKKSLQCGGEHDKPCPPLHSDVK